MCYLDNFLVAFLSILCKTNLNMFNLSFKPVLHAYYNSALKIKKFNSTKLKNKLY